MKSSFRIDRNRVRLTARYGADRDKKTSVNVPWPRSSTPVSLKLNTIDLKISGQKDVLSGLISAQEECYLRSLTMRFHLKGKVFKHFYTNGNEGAPYLTVCNEPGESFIISREKKLRQNVRFSYRPHRHTIEIRWDFNCLLKADAPLSLDRITIETGDQRTQLKILNEEYSQKNRISPGKTERLVWTPPLNPERGEGLKQLETDLSILEEERLFYDQIRLEGLHPREGDWDTVYKDFRGKVGFLTRRMERKGMVPCLAFSPLAASPRSDVYKQHPDWLMHSPKGDPLPALDITRPEVREYLRNALDLFRQWGFRSFHLKGLAILNEAHLLQDNDIESGFLLTETLRFVRKNIGSDETLSGEGIGYLSASGWLHSLSTSPSGTQKQKAADLFRSVLFPGLQNANLNKQLWINNPGNYPLGEQAAALPVQIRESIRQIILISGGVLSFNVKHADLSAEEIDDIRKTIETFQPFTRGELIPLSYSAGKQPAILYNSIGKLGVFNLSGKQQTVSLDLPELQKQIGLNRTGTFIKEGQTGMKTGTLDLILPPYGSRIFNF